MDPPCVMLCYPWLMLPCLMLSLIKAPISNVTPNWSSFVIASTLFFVNFWIVKAIMSYSKACDIGLFYLFSPLRGHSKCLCNQFSWCTNSPFFKIDKDLLFPNLLSRESSIIFLHSIYSLNVNCFQVKKLRQKTQLCCVTRCRFIIKDFLF